MAIINITDYKMDLIKELTSSSEIIEILDSQADGYIKDEPTSLIYRNLWPYLKVPDIQTSADCHLLIAVDIASVNRLNPTYAKYLITIWCLCHQNRMWVDKRIGTRTDLLAQEVLKLLDGRQNFGFSELRLESNRELILNKNYQYRELKFTCNDLRRSVSPQGKRTGR
ncbi:MAG: hypothetical protein FWG70_11895 [Oscillospiraceae bacterium]|nr:hypothetical protein [Oscillospiraceae bacterium]